MSNNMQADRESPPTHPVATSTRRGGHALRIGTIRGRLLITVVAIVLLAAITISAVTVVLGSRDSRQRVLAQLNSVAALKEAEIGSWVQGLRVNLDIVMSEEQVVEDIQVLAQELAEVGGYDAAYVRLRERFQWAAERMGLFEELFLMDSQGRVLLSTNVAHEGERHGDYDYFTQGTEGSYIQQPSYSLSLGEMTVVASRPVDSDGVFLGVLAGRASLASLNLIMLERTGLGETGETYLIGSNHRLLTSLRDEARATPYTYIRTKGARLALDDHMDGSGSYGNYGEATVIGVYRWLPELQVALLAEQEEGEALHTTRIALMIVGAVAAGAVALSVLAAVFLTRSIVSHLAELADTATKIAAGDLDRVARVVRADEIGTVAVAFNTMTSRLRDLVRSLEQRTDQLRSINDVSRRISSILSLDELLPYVARSVQETFRYYNVNILLLDPASGELFLKAGAGGYRGPVPVGRPVLVCEGIIGSVAETGEPILVNDVSQEPRYCFFEELADTRSELAVPIKVGARTVGVLDIESADLEAFDEMDMFTAETLADQLAVAIENAQLYEQAQELATVEERQRLARDLHDAVTQTLFSASLIAEVLPRLWERNPVDGQQRLEELRQLTRGALAEMRMLLLELRPTALTEVGLGDLLRQLTEAVTAKSRLPITLTVDGQCALQPDLQVALYRIAQESVNNIVKHAGASQVEVSLLCNPERVELAIRDDGVGFDPESVSADHLGLGIMRERAEAVGAAITVESQIDRGTQVVVVWTDAQRKE